MSHINSGYCNVSQIEDANEIVICLVDTSDISSSQIEINILRLRLDCPTSVLDASRTFALFMYIASE